MRKKNYNVSTNLSNSADKMIDRIMVCVDDRIKKNSSRVVGAVVTKVNSDGTINVKLPSEEEVEFTRIQNQTPFTLVEGDAVELFLKNGSFSNCWVFAKHGMGATQTTASSFSTSYELPVASSTELGGIRVGGGLSISSSGVLSATGGGTADSVDWSNVQSKPTTLSGYGITDARISSGTIVLGSNSIVPLTSASELNASKLVGSVPSATKAAQDGDGNVISTTYAKKTDIPSLSEYATQSWVQSQGYLTEHQDLSNYALKTEIPTVPAKVSSFENDAGYLTEHQSLSGYATQTWVEQQGYLTEHQDISNLATKTELQAVENKIPTIPTNVSAFENDAGYLTEHQSLADYATQRWVESKGYLTEHQSLADYATQEWVKNQGYLTEHQSLEAYALKTDIPSLEDYATEEWVQNQNYLTEHQSLAGYATETWVENKGYATQTWVENQGYLTEHQSLDAYALKTDLPVVNDGVLTIQKNGTKIDTFSANTDTNKTINIEVPTEASEVGAVSADAIVTNLNNPSNEKIPTAKAVSDAISASGGGDMMKTNYAPDSDDTVSKAFSDQNGNNIASTYMPKFSLLNNIDANTLTTSQIGIIGTGNTNLPDNASGSVLFVAGGGSNAFQITVTYTANILYHRAYKDGAWTIWRSSEVSTSASETTDFSAYGLGFITMD